MTAPPTLAEATAFVLNAATSEDLDRLVDAVKQRRTILREINAAAVHIGTDVRLTGLSPKYLNGLTGTIISIKNKRATVLLDADSTRRLRYDGIRRFPVPDDVERHEFGGVPLGCCEVV